MPRQLRNLKAGPMAIWLKRCDYSQRKCKRKPQKEFSLKLCPPSIKVSLSIFAIWMVHFLAVAWVRDIFYCSAVASVWVNYFENSLNYWSMLGRSIILFFSIPRKIFWSFSLRSLVEVKSIKVLQFLLMKLILWPKQNLGNWFLWNERMFHRSETVMDKTKTKLLRENCVYSSKWYQR